MSLSSFDTGYLLEQWPGAVDLVVDAHGDWTNDSASAELNIHSLGGQVKGQQLSGGGSVVMGDGTVGLKEVYLQFGESVFTADGQVREGGSLSFSGKVSDLALFVENSSGSLQYSGSYRGDGNEGGLHFDIKGTEISTGAFSVTSLQGRGDATFGANGTVNLEAAAKEIIVQAIPFEEALLTASGTVAQHNFSASIKGDNGSGNFSGRGGYQEVWKATIDGGKIEVPDFLNIQLNGPAEIEAEKTRFSASNICFDGNLMEGCVDKAGVDNGEWKLAGWLSDLSFSKVGAILLPEASVKGLGAASFTASGNMDGAFIMESEIQTNGLAISGSVQGKDVEYEFTENTITMSVDDGGFVLHGDNKLTDDSYLLLDVTGKKESGDASWLQNTDLKGNVSFVIQDLSFVPLFTASMMETSGKLEGDLSITGSLGAPSFNGNVELVDGSFQLQEYGLDLKNLTFQLQSEGRTVSFDVEALSGPGSVRAGGKLDITSEAGWQLETTVKGDNFTLMNTEEYEIRVDSDLQFSSDTSGGWLKGDISVPFARITLSSKNGKISPSDDVVVVDGQSAGTDDWRLAIHLNIQLEDDVQIKAYGLESYLRGGLELRDEPGKAFSAWGELDVVDGHFVFYSTELDINRGKLLFGGGPIDNPGVDFRAQREVDDKVVGVDVGGTAKELDFHLFSDPVMEESNILAYIVVGRSLYASKENDQSLIGAAATAIGLRGVNEITSKVGRYLPIDEIYLDGGSSSEDMSLVVGKHITEDIFIGYDHNFFDAAGEFKILYDIGYGFSFETNTSVQSTSGDIFYSIER